MSTTTRPPSKPWRVYLGTRGISDDYRSQRAAYEAVTRVTKLGRTAKVYHWEGGSWRLYEVIEPTPDTTASSTEKGQDR